MTTVQEVITRARKAQRELAKLDQAGVDDIVTAVAWVGAGSFWWSDWPSLSSRC